MTPEEQALIDRMKATQQAYQQKILISGKPTLSEADYLGYDASRGAHIGRTIDDGIILMDAITNASPTIEESVSVQRVGSIVLWDSTPT